MQVPLFVRNYQLKYSKTNTYQYFLSIGITLFCFPNCLRLINRQAIHKPPEFLHGKTSCLFRCTWPFEASGNRKAWHVYTDKRDRIALSLSFLTFTASINMPTMFLNLEMSRIMERILFNSCLSPKISVSCFWMISRSN